MKKILFGITSLTLGGAERVLVDICNKLSDKYVITILTIYGNGELEKQLNKNVKLKSIYEFSYMEMSKFQKKLLPLKLLVNKKKIYEENIKNKYDIEVAFLEGPITRLLSVKNQKVNKIAWIHNDISLVFGKGIKAYLKKYIDQKIYLKYKSLVFVSKDNLEKFNKTYKNIKSLNKQVIYNYIDKDEVKKKSNEKLDIELSNEQLNFITVCRLTKQKGIDRLIKVYSKLQKDGYKSKFYVIGDGPEKENLEDMIRENNIEKTFKLLGKKENPYPYMKEADYFCLLSNFEGYGMVLEEAKILNKNIIITDTAAREAVENYYNSTIIENSEQGIYEGLKEVILKRNETKNKENNFLEKATNIEVYDNGKIIDEILELIEKN